MCYVVFAQGEKSKILAHNTGYVSVYSICFNEITILTGTTSDVSIPGHLLVSEQWDSETMARQPGAQQNYRKNNNHRQDKSILCLKIAPLWPALINWKQQNGITLSECLNIGKDFIQT